MTDLELSKFTNQLRKIISKFMEIDAAASDNRAAVILDQTSIGRVSRMDAMQQQAMANTTSQQRQSKLDVSRNCAAPLTAYYALKENIYGIETTNRT